MLYPRLFLVDVLILLILLFSQIAVFKLQNPALAQFDTQLSLDVTLQGYVSGKPFFILLRNYALQRFVWAVSLL